MLYLCGPSGWDGLLGRILTTAGPRGTLVVYACCPFRAWGEWGAWTYVAATWRCDP